MTSNTGPILVFPRNQPFGSDRFFISWQSVLTTCHWFCELGEFFSVFCHEVLSDFNCCQESCISTNFFITLFCCESFFTRSWYFCNKSSCAGFSVEGVGAFVNKLAGSNNGSDCSASTGLTVFLGRCCTHYTNLRLLCRY